MTTPAPGDTVTVQIVGRIAWISGSIGHFQLEYGTPLSDGDDFRSIVVYPDEPAVTVTPHTDGGAEGLDVEAIRARAEARYAPDIFAAPGDVHALLDELDRLRASAGIEAAIEAAHVALAPRLGGENLRHWITEAAIRAAAVHLDAGRAAEEKVAELGRSLRITQEMHRSIFKARRECGEENVDLRVRVADLEAELAEARATIRVLAAAPQPITLDNEVTLTDDEMQRLRSTYASPTPVRITPAAERNPVSGLIGLFATDHTDLSARAKDIAAGRDEL